MSRRNFLTIGTLLATLALTSCATTPKEKRPVRVAVIGGMMRTGLWPEMARRFEADTGCKVELATSGNRELLAAAFRDGRADLATMHASETASNLVSDGYARNMRTWTRNEFVIIGPRSDPACVRGLRDGAEALRRIARAQAPFVDFQNSGTRDIAARLWSKAGIRPEGDWLLQDESDSSEEAMEFARKKQAYVVLARIPVIYGLFAADGMEILVKGDPDMRRPFVVMETNPKRFPEANAKGARALAEYLLDTRTQNFLLAFGTNTPTGAPQFCPANRP